jgi:hypothetical protein
MTSEEVATIAKQHEGQYLISWPDYQDKGSAIYRACAGLVSSGRARWLDIKTPASEGYGEPGPGIQLTGRDAQEEREYGAMDSEHLA